MNFADELERLDKAATEPEWFDDYGKIGHEDGGIGEMDLGQDAALIVYMRNHAAAIARLVRAAESVIAECDAPDSDWSPKLGEKIDDVEQALSDLNKEPEK